MNKFTFKEKCNKQIEVSERFVKFLENCLEVLEKFDGKMINVKIQRALEEKFKDFGFTIRVDHSSSKMSVEDYKNVYYNIISSDGDVVRYRQAGKVDYTRFSVSLSTADSDKVDMKEVRANIDVEISYQKEKIDLYKKMRDQCNKAEEEFNELKKMARAFSSKYNYILRDDCEFEFNRLY